MISKTWDSSKHGGGDNGDGGGSSDADVLHINPETCGSEGRWFIEIEVGEEEDCQKTGTSACHLARNNNNIIRDA